MKRPMVIVLAALVLTMVGCGKSSHNGASEAGATVAN